MRRLTLILSDLFLPVEAGDQAAPAAMALPNFEWLLRFAMTAPIAEWRHWLAEESSVAHAAEWPIARTCALAAGLPTAGAWLATPVHLEARLDHVRLTDRGLLRLSPEERAAWRADFARAFGPELSLHDAGERGFLLSGGPHLDTRTVDPARLLDADISSSLPGRAPELRKLGIEIEMWLHGSALNTHRERAGKRRVSALWLWGGGTVEPVAPPAPPPSQAYFRLFGGDPYLEALGKLAPYQGFIRHERASPANGFAGLELDCPVTVELTPMSGPPSESMTMLDTQWFAPARAALASGALERLDLVVNDLRFRVASRSGWKLWRRRRSWVEHLMLARVDPKA
jgi:hypothetical protein